MTIISAKTKYFCANTEPSWLLLLLLQVSYSKTLQQFCMSLSMARTLPLEKSLTWNDTFIKLCILQYYSSLYVSIYHTFNTMRVMGHLCLNWCKWMTKNNYPPFAEPSCRDKLTLAPRRGFPLQSGRAGEVVYLFDSPCLSLFCRLIGIFFSFMAIILGHSAIIVHSLHDMWWKITILATAVVG